jgi:hypothetical protein
MKKAKAAIYPISISTEFSKFWKAVETEHFIYYSSYKDDDVLMYRKEPFELVSDNYFAQNDVFEVIVEKKYTWLSKTMKYNAKEMQKQFEGNNKDLN